jgi:hypothetical protein
LRETFSQLQAANRRFRIADGNGGYEFRNLAPGKYTLEIDPATLPETSACSEPDLAITISPL